MSRINPLHLSGIGLFTLKLLYKEPEYSGDLVDLLKDREATKDQAQQVGRELARYGLIDYDETREHADAVLTQSGVAYAKTLH